MEHLLAEGRLVELFPDWPDERFPLYALYPSRHHVPAKVRMFLNFIALLSTASEKILGAIESRLAGPNGQARNCP